MFNNIFHRSAGDKAKDAADDVAHSAKRNAKDAGLRCTVYDDVS